MFVQLALEYGSIQFAVCVGGRSLRLVAFAARMRSETVSPGRLLKYDFVLHAILSCSLTPMMTLLSSSVITANRCQIHWLQLSVCILKDAQAMCKFALDAVKRVSQLLAPRVISEIGALRVTLATKSSCGRVNTANTARLALVP